jgi:hypothetical protein
MNTLLALRALDVTWMEKIGDGSSGALGVSELAHDAKTSRTLQTSLLATRRSDCNRGGIFRASRVDRRPLGLLGTAGGSSWSHRSRKGWNLIMGHITKRGRSLQGTLARPRWPRAVTDVF